MCQHASFAIRDKIALSDELAAEEKQSERNRGTTIVDATGAVMLSDNNEEIRYRSRAGS